MPGVSSQAVGDIYIYIHGVWGGVVVKAPRYQSDGPRIDFRWCHWGFFLWLLPKESCALGSTQPLKMSTRDFSWGKGSRCIWLTTYHPRSAECQENPGPQPNRNPRGHLGLLRDDLYFYIYIYTGCPRRNGQNFGRVFLMLNYTDITQNTYIQS